MIKLEEAVSLAKNFLNNSGIYFASLEEVSLKDRKWVVVLTSILGTLFGRYTVELDEETGDIVGFKKEGPGA